MFFLCSSFSGFNYERARLEKPFTARRWLSSPTILMIHVLANIIFPAITYIFHYNYNPRINWDKNVTVDNMKNLGIILFPL